MHVPEVLMFQILEFVHSSLHALITKKRMFSVSNYPSQYAASGGEKKPQQLPISLLFASQLYNHHSWTERILLSDRFRENLCAYLTGRGELVPLKWALQRHCPYDEGRCLVIAARVGHLRILQWIQQEEVNRGSTSSCINWAENICIAAARGGHLEVIRWLRLQGCPWNEYGTKY